MRTAKNLLAALGVFALVGAAVAAPLQRGQHYQPIDPPQPTEVAGKVEVIEFFSYGCPHCYHLEASINPWVRKLPADVNFVRVPLAGGSWAASAKLYYALEAMGIEDKLRAEVFAAIHKEKPALNYGDEAAILAWIGKKGVDAKKFADIYKSFAIHTRTQRAVQMATSHKVSGVPAIAVDGRFLVLNKTIQSYDDLLNLADQVIAMARTSK